jgi:hypothetical protein
MSAELKGAKELAAFLKQAPKEVAVKAGRQGLAKSSARLRTFIRRAAPRKTGKLRAAIQSKVGRSAPIAWVRLGTRFYYKTLEFGRAAHKRKGKPRAGSPQMSRFAFFKKAVATHSAEIMQMTIDQTRSALFKEAGRLIARTGAPIKRRGGR